jgi:hypothetical protein
MPLENPSAPVTPDQLNGAWPLPEDPKSAGDDHIRIIKQALIETWRKLNFSALPSGAIPVYLNGKLVDAGLSFTGGTTVFGRPLVAPQFIQAGGLNPESRQLVGIKTNDMGVSRPDVPTTAALTELIIQPIDSSVNTLPIAFSFLQDSDALVKGVIVRSTTAVSRVRLTLRDTGPSGEIVYQTATDAEIESGGGATLAALGESQINFPQKLEMFAGRTIHVTIERYSIETNSIVNTGITLKGTTISSIFIPYQRSVRQAITRKGVAVKSDLPHLSLLLDATGQTLSSTPVNVGSFTFNNAEAIPALIEADVFIQGIPNANVTINIVIDGVLVDSGGGFTARITNATANMAYPVRALAVKTLSAGVHTIIISATLSTGSAQKLITKVLVGRSDTGALWE